MICPRCVNNKTKVVGTVSGTINERFRKCPKCGYHFITNEIIKYDGYSKFYIENLFKDEFDEIEKGKK